MWLILSSHRTTFRKRIGYDKTSEREVDVPDGVPLHLKELRAGRSVPLHSGGEAEIQSFHFKAAQSDL